MMYLVQEKMISINIYEVTRLTNVSAVFLVLTVFVSLLLAITWYILWKLFVYSQFVNHFWVDWNLIRVLLLGKQSERSAYIFQKFDGLCKKYESEGMFVLWIGEPALVVFGEGAIKFFSNAASLTDKPNFYNLFKFMGETSIFVSSGKHLKKLKNIMKPAFYPNVIKNIVPVMNHHATCLIVTLGETKGEVTDRIEEFLKNHALRTFIEASMGVKADTEENKVKIRRLVNLFIQLLAIASYRLVSPWLHSDFTLKFSYVGRQYAKLKEELDSIMNEVLEDIKENVRSRTESKKSISEDTENNETHQKSLGEVLIEQHLKDPSFDMEEVKNQVTGILTGGYDTTSNTLMWCFWLLGHHQDIQQKAYEEVMTVGNGNVQYEDARNLTYLECILKETLRLYPPAPLYARVSNKDIKYDKYVVPKGTPVIMYLYHLHRNPKLYSKPDDFIPERFSDSESNIKPWIHIPFAEGVRSCIGKHFAMLEMKIVLSHVLQKFKLFSLDRQEDVTLIYEIILKSARPLRMQFIPR